MNNRPNCQELLAIARETFTAEVLPALPEKLRYTGLMIANALAIARRELDAGEAPLRVEYERLCALLCESPRALAGDALRGAMYDIVPLEYDSRYPYNATGRMTATPETNYVDPLLALTAIAAETRLMISTALGVVLLPDCSIRRESRDPAAVRLTSPSSCGSGPAAWSITSAASTGPPAVCPTSRRRRASLRPSSVAESHMAPIYTPSTSAVTPTKTSTGPSIIGSP